MKQTLSLWYYLVIEYKMSIHGVFNVEIKYDELEITTRVISPSTAF